MFLYNATAAATYMALLTWLFFHIYTSIAPAAAATKSELGTLFLFCAQLLSVFAGEQ
jgi:hypothetical protein